MATISFNDVLAGLAANPPVDLLADFDPAVDILLFISDSAATIDIAVIDENSVQITTAAGSAVLPVPFESISTVLNGNIQFGDGSGFFVGDGDPAAVGDPLGNLIVGTPGADQIWGLGGPDIITGEQAPDLIYGNGGDDLIYAIPQAGEDTAYGGRGNDTIDYFPDVVGVFAYGNLDNDLIDGSNIGDDVLYGGQGDDTIGGNGGNDKIYGNADDDLIFGGLGNDTSYGGRGDDTIFAGSGTNSNVAYGNLDNDSILAAIGGDTLYGGQGLDTLIGDDGDDEMRGNAGDDSIVSGPNGGVDTVIAGLGADTLAWDATANTDVQWLDFFNVDNDAIISLAPGITATTLANDAIGGAIVDTNTRGNLLSGSSIVLFDAGTGGAVSLTGAAGEHLDRNNLILADGSIFVYNVGGEQNGFSGDNQNDVLICGDNGDTMVLGEGTDLVIGGTGADIAMANEDLDTTDNFQMGDGADTMNMLGYAGLTAAPTTKSLDFVVMGWQGGAGTTALTFSQSEAMTVNATGLSANQNLLLNANGVTGGITCYGGTGDDQIYGAISGSVTSLLYGGDGDDFLYSYQGPDGLFGDAGNDTLFAGEGKDNMTGGLGIDRFIFMASDSGFTENEVDRITLFDVSADVIRFQGAVALPTQVFNQQINDYDGAANLAAAAQAAYNDSAGIAAYDAILFDYGGRTFVFANDGAGAFSTTSDLLVEVTQLNGAFTTANFTL